MARLLKPDGTVTEISPANGKNFTMQEVRDLIGHRIRVVQTRDGRLMVVNEISRLQIWLPFNEQATALYLYGQSERIVGDPLVGSMEEIGEDSNEEDE